MSGFAAATRPETAAPLVTVLSVSQGSMKNFNYLIVDPASRQAVIVDPAWEIDKIDQAIADAQCELRGVLLTHSHPDHINLAKAVGEKYGCPLLMHRAEIIASGFSAPRLVAVGEQPWTFGQMTVEPIFTPGHTPGSTCYRIEDNLFTGDVLFAEGCGLCPDLPAALAMFDSLERLKRLAPRTRVYPGHSYGQPPGRTMAQLLQENIYLQFSDSKSFSAFRLRRGQDRARLFSFR